MNLKIALFVCFSISLFSGTNLFAQDEPLISSKKLLKDFDQLLKIIDTHPDPYVDIVEEDFDLYAEEVRTSLNQPHTTLAFFKKIAATVALLKDGHSNVSLPSDWVIKTVKKRGVFPCEFYLNNENELFLVKNINGNTIPEGAEIISINGMLIEDFLEKIDPYISYELNSFRNAVIESIFEQYLYIAFDFFDAITLEYYTSDTLTTVINNMPYTEWVKYSEENRDTSINNKAPYSYEKTAEGIGLIRLYSFSFHDRINYNTFLTETFATIKNDSIHSLIIDVRGNPGGDVRNVINFFHYITKHDVKVIDRFDKKASQAYKDYLLENQLEPHFEIDTSYVSQVNDQGLVFEGDCYLLADRNSYSAAAVFASVFQCYQMGLIIGQETGGTKIFSAEAITKTLNKSDVVIRMSTTKLYSACSSRELEGVKPTIEYTPSVFEIISGIDTQVLFTQRLIKKVQEQKALENND